MINKVLDVIKIRKELIRQKNKQSNIIKGYLKGFYERSKLQKYLKAYSLHLESKSIVMCRERVQNNLRNLLYDWKRQTVWQKCINEMDLSQNRNQTIYTYNSNLSSENSEITLSNNYITDKYKLMYRFFDNWYDSINWTKFYTINYYYNRSNLKRGFRGFANYVPDRVVRCKKNKILKIKLATTIYNYNLCYKSFKQWKSISLDN